MNRSNTAAERPGESRASGPERTGVPDLAGLRSAVGARQAEVVERSGLRRETVSRLEQGRGNPTAATLYRYGTGLGGEMSLRFTIGERTYEIPLPRPATERSGG